MKKNLEGSVKKENGNRRLRIGDLTTRRIKEGVEKIFISGHQEMDVDLSRMTYQSLTNFPNIVCTRQYGKVYSKISKSRYTDQLYYTKKTHQDLKKSRGETGLPWTTGRQELGKAFQKWWYMNKLCKNE